MLKSVFNHFSRLFSHSSCVYHLGHGKTTDQSEYRDFYEDLFDRVERNVVPLRRDEHLEEIFYRILEPEQATFLSHMPVGLIPIDVIEERFSDDYTPEEYKKLVDDLLFLGFLQLLQFGEEKFMYFPEFIVGWGEFFWMRDRNNEFPDEEMAPLFWEYACDKYADEIFEENGENYRTKIVKSFVLEEVIPPHVEILNFETASGVFKEADFIGVTRCICKTVCNELHPEKKLSEKYPTECCFSIDEHGESLVKFGFAREVGVDEALKILEECHDSGLVSNADNQAHPTFICNCSKDACALFEMYNRGVKHILCPTRFICEINEAVRDEKCIGCSICVERCNIGLFSVENDKVVMTGGEYCLGCGNCVKYCPMDVLEMKERLPGKPEFYYRAGDAEIEGGEMMPWDMVERLVFYCAEQKRLNTIICSDTEKFGMKTARKCVKWLECNPVSSKILFNDWVLKMMCKKVKKDLNFVERD